MKCIIILLIIIAMSAAHESDLRGHLKDKIGDFVKSATWKAFEWNAEVGGSLVVSVLQKFRVPIDTVLAGKDHHPSSCAEIMKHELNSKDGVYTIYPNGMKGLKAFCDMKTDKGGWTVFQRRFNGKVDFYRGWDDYKKGFGDPSGEYWLGNEALHMLTKKGGCKLRIDLVSLNDETGFAEFSNFSVGSEPEGYPLAIDRYSGTTGDPLSYHKGQKFSTKDKDNDKNSSNCAANYHGAWWYNQCHWANLNGKYGGSGNKYMRWHDWKTTGENGFMKKTKMMLKC